MAEIRRIVTKRPTTPPAILIELDDGRTLEIDNYNIDPANLPGLVDVHIAGLEDNIYFHKNRDGSFAVATGAEPAVWPEDYNKD